VANDRQLLKFGTTHHAPLYHHNHTDLQGFLAAINTEQIFNITFIHYSSV